MYLVIGPSKSPPPPLSSWVESNSHSCTLKVQSSLQDNVPLAYSKLSHVSSNSASPSHSSPGSIISSPQFGFKLIGPIISEVSLRISFILDFIAYLSPSSGVSYV